MLAILITIPTWSLVLACGLPLDKSLLSENIICSGNTVVTVLKSIILWIHRSWETSLRIIYEPRCDSGQYLDP